MVTTPVLTTKVDPVEILEDDYDYDANVLAPDVFDEIPEGMEFVDGALVEKPEVTILHSAVQGKLVWHWTNYAQTSSQGGDVYPEAPCRTLTQKRRPDVAYVTPAMRQQQGRPNIYPQAFPLIAEIASPDDSAEMLLQKAREYLAAGAEEVWILLPESGFGLIVLADQVLGFTANQTIATQRVLPGFAIELSELFT
jgi:Uma2 family endonuclease